MARLKAFLLELFSLLSRLLNVLSGGTADMTFSARAYRDGLRAEPLINFFALPLVDEENRCRV